FQGHVQVIMSNSFSIQKAVSTADLLIGAVLIAGAKAPTLVTEDMVKQMKTGSVIVDVAVDQGGCIETVDRVTTHDNPTYVKHGVVHYCVANMPGAVPSTSTMALTNVTLPYIQQLANKGLTDAFRDNAALHKGLNITRARIVNDAVAKSLGGKSIVHN
ncbi:MAG: alanine dehydrogenase, partial [Bacilli bacterium]